MLQLYSSLGHDHFGMVSNLPYVQLTLRTSTVLHQQQGSMHNLHSSSVCIFVVDIMMYLLHDTRKKAHCWLLFAFCLVFFCFLFCDFCDARVGAWDDGLSHQCNGMWFCH